MIGLILNDKDLLNVVMESCEDEGLYAPIDPELLPDDYVILKVDLYYANLRLALTPKSIDNIVAVDCQCNKFSLYLIEFKDLNSPSNLNVHDIHQKFQNTIDDFLSNRFSYIFLNDRFSYKSIKLYFISDLYRVREKYSSHEDFRRLREKIGRRDTLSVDLSLGSKLFRFRGRPLKIEYDIPPNPLITRIV